MIRRGLWLLLALLGGGLLLAPPAAAHATVVSSTPTDGSRLRTAPSVVSITFDESVGIGGVAYLHVIDQHGTRVDAGAAYHPNGNAATVDDRLKPNLRDGTYTASYRVVSADSHPVAGTVVFVVGNGALVRSSSDATTSAGSASQVFQVVRWISYTGIALLGGAWLLLTVWPGGRGDRRAQLLVWGGWGLTAAGAAGELLMQGPFSGGLSVWRLFDPTLIDATLHSNYGLLHCLRLILLGALAGVFAHSLRPGARLTWAPGVAGLLGLVIATSFAAGGHAATTSPTWLSIPVDALHVVAMAVWLGGLAILLFAVLPRRQPAELAVVLPWFSTVAFGSVLVLAGTGTYAAWRGIGSVDALTTGYGLLVLGKIALFIGLILAGNASRLAVQRRALAAVAPAGAAAAPSGADLAPAEVAVAPVAGRVAVGASHMPQSAAGGSHAALPSSDGLDEGPGDDLDVEVEQLRRSVSLEVLLGVAVLFLTSVLVAQPRGPEALAASYQQPVSASAALGDGRHVTVVADPGVHGRITFTVAVDKGARVSVAADATQKSAQVGPLPLDLTRRGARAFDGSNILVVAGGWTIHLVVSTSQFDAVSADVPIYLH